MKSNLVVAVTGLNATDNPGPGVAVARSLMLASHSLGLSVKVVGLCYEAAEPGAFIDGLFSQCCIIPPLSSGKSAFFARLAEVCTRLKVDVVIPNFDAELPFFISLQSSLLKIGVHSFLPSAQQLEACAKWSLPSACKQMGLNHPVTRVLDGISSLSTQQVSLPCFVKGKYYGAAYCSSFDEVVRHASGFVAEWGGPFLVQEPLEGQEYNVVAVGDGCGGLLSCVAMRKMYVTKLGKAWSGITVRDPRLLSMASAFALHTKWRGGFELELLQTRSGVLYVLEVNSRFPAWVYLASAAGQNMPWQVASLAMGITPPALSAYEAGKIFLRYSWDNVIDNNSLVAFATSLNRLPNQ